MYIVDCWRGVVKGSFLEKVNWVMKERYELWGVLKWKSDKKKGYVMWCERMWS